MEEKNQNQEVELSSLQMQYKTLQEKFNQQEIVNNDLIHEMIHAKIANFKQRNAEIILTYGLLAATVCWSCFRFDLSIPFMVISIILFGLIGLFEWFSCRKVLKTNTENTDIQTLAQTMKNVCTRFSLVWITGVFALCVWMMWFIFEVGEKRTIPYLRSSFIVVAIILAIAIVLIICNIDRLAKMSDELLAQTSRLNGEDAPVPPTYHHSGAYWSGIILLVLCLVGLVFKLMYWPFGSLILMVASLAGLVFACLTGRHLVRIVPEERPVIRIAGVAGLFLVANAAFYLFDWPLGNIIGFISVLLLLIAALVYWLRQRRGRNHGKA